MPQFRVNVPVIQPDPKTEVVVAAGSELPIGLNRFSLVVIDDAGNESEAAILSVIVQDKERPTAVLDMINDAGARTDPVVPFGASFILSGDRSTDKEPGKIIEYRFTLLEQG